ncbi:hypothetical protein [Roseovarius spongiae]|uniref:hypothetical protein n=1 Tax=Roseovarius spongiae TaxID=2320272 RepID=UPI00140CF341|nr:hypothetical protein [Roseovarius spongiae]
MHQTWQTPDRPALRPDAPAFARLDRTEVLQAALVSDCRDAEWIIDRTAALNERDA